MTEAAAGPDVPVEPVWYEAPPEPSAPVATALPVEAPAPAPTPDDILPSVEPPPVVEAPLPQAAAAEPEQTRPPRRWRTPHLAAAVVLALVIGFIVGRVTDSSGGGASSNSSASGASTKHTNSGTEPSAGAQQAQTPPPAPGATATSATPGAVNGHTVLLNIPRHAGPLVTDHFTVAATRWVLGWAYDCTGQPGGTGAFNITVFDGAGGPSKDGGIDQQGAKGSSVVAYTSTGERYLSVTTNCVWAIRVTT